MSAINTIVAANAGNASTSNPVSQNWTSNLTPGSLVVGALSQDSQSNSNWLVSVSDNGGTAANVYTVLPKIYDSTSGQTMTVFYGYINEVANVLTVTCQTNPVAYWSFMAVEYNNAHPASPFDKYVPNTADCTTATDNITSTATATLSQADELVIGIAADQNAAAVQSAGTGYTFDGRSAATHNYNVTVESKVVSSTSPVTATFTSSAVSRYNAAVLTFKLNAGAADTENPTVPTAFTLDTIDTTTVRLATCTGATDNVGVVSYDVSINGGSTAYQTGIAVGGNITGLTAGQNYADVRVRARDAAGNVSPWSTYRANLTMKAASTSASTSALWASGTPTTAQSAGSWANATAATGANNASGATWTSTGSGATGSIIPAAFGAQAAIGSQPESITNVVVTAYACVTGNISRMSNIAVQLADAGTVFGTAQNFTARSLTTTYSENFTFTGVTWAQLANLGARILFTRAAVTTACNGVVDAVKIVVNYTVAGAAGSVSYLSPGPPTVTVWNGTTEKAATVSVWDGTTEIAVTLDMAQP